MAWYIQYQHIYPTELYSPNCWQPISNTTGLFYRNVHFPSLCPKGTKKPSNLHLSPNCWHGISNINHQKPPRLNTSITSICHNRKHHGQYINHINQSYQKPPVSIHQPHHHRNTTTSSLQHNHIITATQPHHHRNTTTLSLQ